MIFYVNRICEKSIQNLTAVDAKVFVPKKNGVANGLLKKMKIVAVTGLEPATYRHTLSL